MTKIVCISDSHSQHDKLNVPDGDILFHAGDYSSMGYPKECDDFMQWFSSQPHKYKIFISGNHDFMDEDHPEEFRRLLHNYPDILYLRDSGTEIEGFKIWGRPWTPTFFDWAFMKDRESAAMRSTLDIIPQDIDILLTHGPAYGILDKCRSGDVVGCEDLLELIADKPNLKLMIFGHIHESAGMKEVNGIKHINAAVLNHRYKKHGEGIVVEL